MPEISIVNISELGATSSVNGEMLFAVEIPGQGIKKITKNNLFKLFGTALNINTVVGSNKFLGFDDTVFGFYYLHASEPSAVIIRLNQVYFSTDGGVAGIFIDSVNSVLGVIAPGGNGKIQINIDTKRLTLTLDDNFAENLDAYLGTSLDQQFRLVDPFTDGTGTSAISCQRSILKVATTTNASNQIAFPATPKNGYTFELTISGTITALTLTAGTDTRSEE